MRERALAATPGPWKAHGQHDDWYVSGTASGQVSTGINEEPSLPEFLMIERDRQDAEFIAGMHPVVALAVADWLEREAAQAKVLDGYEGTEVYRLMLEGYRLPLAVARAFLGEAEGPAHD
jgi:hypothetical protein